MKRIIFFLIIVLPFIPLQSVFADSQTPSTITLTAGQVSSAVDIEAAIISATARGTRPGTVILDGQKGPFVLTADDRSVNIFVSNLTLRGVNQAVIKNCDDGLFFDSFPLKHILVEGIMFLCTGDGVEATGVLRDVTLQNNVFQAANNGIGAGGYSSGWVIAGNLILAGGDGIRMTGAERAVISSNHVSANTGIVLLQCSQSQVHHNAVQATYQGVLLGQESWNNLAQANTILGVSAAGIALEPGVAGNTVAANKVQCALGVNCQTVDASAEIAKRNTIGGNNAPIIEI